MSCVFFFFFLIVCLILLLVHLSVLKSCTLAKNQKISSCPYSFRLATPAYVSCFARVKCLVISIMCCLGYNILWTDRYILGRMLTLYPATFLKVINNNWSSPYHLKLRFVSED